MLTSRFLLLAPRTPPRATPEVVNGFVVGATITDGGCGYTNTPLVLIEGGGGSGATAIAVVSNGVVVSIIITDAGIDYTNMPTIVIGSTPFITSQPQSVTVNAHDNASFNVTATGFPLLTYQWSLNNTNIWGATNSMFAITNVTQTNLGAYAVVVTNDFGSATNSNAMLLMYPYIVNPFTGAVTNWGENATLSVRAWGTGPLSYQWFLNGVAIQGATNDVLTLSSIQFTNAGLYSVVISSSLGSVTNAPAQVTVTGPELSLALYPGVTINGVVGYTYTIQSTVNVADTNSWVTLTNLTLTQPMQLWVDTNVNASLPTNRYHFYRVLPGQ